MNQKCKVCGEPAAGFHFGAFTCEGCKSFFGRTYNNLSSISECKNNGECIINKKNRTACKACRLRKCLVVGMSKSGSRYGRRSNWFKIHCLLQEQQQQQQQQQQKTSGNNNNNNNNNLTSNNNATNHNNSSTIATSNSNNSNENSNNSTSSPGLSISNGFLPNSFLSHLCHNNNNNNNNVINNNHNNNTSKKGLKRSSTPSDSGASSADPDDGGGGGVVGGGGVGGIGGAGNAFKDQVLPAGPEVNGLGKSEPPEISLSKFPPKLSRTPPASSALPSLTETYRPLLFERMSPYLPGVPLRPDGSPFFPVAFSLPPVSLAMLSSGHAKRDAQSEPIDLSMKSKSSSRSASSESPLRIDARSPLPVDPGDNEGKLSPSAALAPKTVPLDLSTFVRSKALSG